MSSRELVIGFCMVWELVLGIKVGGCRDVVVGVILGICGGIG